MTSTLPRPTAVGDQYGYPGPIRRTPRGSRLAALLRTTDAKQIGLLYLTTSFGFFVAAGIMALLMRAELARPGMQFLSPEQYNQLFTMHGTVMMLLFATPLVFGFANYLVPLQIGAPDVAFPRLNSLAYWLYLPGGLLVLGGFLTPSSGMKLERAVRSNRGHHAHVLDVQWPRPDLMVESGSGGGPVRIDSADMRRADHPTRIAPTVGQHREHPLRRGADHHRRGCHRDPQAKPATKPFPVRTQTNTPPRGELRPLQTVLADHVEDEESEQFPELRGRVRSSS